MTDAWFSPETAKFFSYLSLLSLCSLFAIPASKGRLRGLAVGVWTAVLVFAALLLGAGALAVAAGQPAHVTRALLVSGVVLGVLFAATRRALIRGYTEAEVRRTVAADL
jgi:heme/copper-type cytochrome/quinol oxidase subunit 3